MLERFGKLAGDNRFLNEKIFRLRRLSDKIGGEADLMASATSCSV